MQTAERHVKRVATIRADSSVHAAAHTMHAEAVGCLVVLDDDERVVGIVTDRDLTVRAIAWSHAPGDMRVENVMTRDPVTTTPSVLVRDVLALMKSHGVRRVPVLLDDKAVGIVALDDILEELSRELRDLAIEAPRRYRTAPSASRFEHVRAGIERGVEEVRSKLEYAQWYARETVLDELDALRERLSGNRPH